MKTFYVFRRPFPNKYLDMTKSSCAAVPTIQEASQFETVTEPQEIS